MLARIAQLIRSALLWTCALLAIAVSVLAVRGFWRCDEAGYFWWKDKPGTDGLDYRGIVGSCRGGLYWLGTCCDVVNPDWYGGAPAEVIVNSGPHAAMAMQAVRWMPKPFQPVGRWEWLGFNFVNEHGASMVAKSTVHGVGTGLVVPDWILIVLLGWLPAGRLRARGVIRWRRRRALCLQCGYDVRESPRICPECGADLNVQRSDVPSRWRLRLGWVAAAGVVLCLAVGLPWGLHAWASTPVTLKAGALLSAKHAPAGLQLDLAPGMAMRFALIPSGRFMMGSPATELARGDDETLHEVVISRPFYMAVTPVTQEQYAAVMGARPSFYKGANKAVDSVTWDAADAFCKELSRRTGRHICLPTEAQWEYACRAGTSTPFNTGDTLPRQSAAYDASRSYPSDRFAPRAGLGAPVPVGSFAPNAFGLYDMHGLLWQWCNDWYGDYPTGNVTDPIGPARGDSRILRGSASYFPPRYCRSAYRQWTSPGYVRSYFGFRVAMAFLK